jgi:proteasome lid subunit RPN8/RPN11
VRIRRAAVDAIVDHARRDAPLECCGLLIGSPDLVEETWCAPNTRNSPVAFLIDPAAHFAAIHRARAAGLHLIGAYHSHPQSPAVPSATDIRESNDPELLHVIVSLAEPEPVMRAYRIRDEGIIEVTLEVS